MHHAVAMDVIQSVRDMDGDRSGALQRQLAAVLKNLPQEPAIHPLHYHVQLATVVVVQYLHHAWMVQFLADLGLTLKTIE